MFVVIVIGLTYGIAVAPGRMIAKRSRGLACLASGLLVPLLIAVAAYLVLYLSPIEPSPNDGAAMAAFGLLMFAALSLPISLITSVLLFTMVWPADTHGK